MHCRVVTQDLHPLSTQISYHAPSCSDLPCFASFLQRETLLRQLETNQLDIDATLEELSVQQETEDQNYELYVPEPSFPPLLLLSGSHLTAVWPPKGSRRWQFGFLWIL